MKITENGSSQNLLLSGAKVARLSSALPRGAYRKICEATGKSPYIIKKNLRPKPEFDRAVIEAALAIYNSTSLTGTITLSDLQ